jgi:hypothetical protein
MIIAYWVVAGVVAALCLGVGALKIVRTPEQLRTMGQAWVEDFAPLQIKLIGGAEVLGALGLILPMATGILPVLSPIAGVGIALLQLGAFLTHARRGNEVRNMIGNAVIFALAGVAAALGFFVLAGA